MKFASFINYARFFLFKYIFWKYIFFYPLHQVQVPRWILITGQISNSGPEKICPVNTTFVFGFIKTWWTVKEFTIWSQLDCQVILFRLQEVGLSSTWTVSTITKISSKCRQLVKLFLGLWRFSKGVENRKGMIMVLSDWLNDKVYSRPADL
jgi:hypothetical protein